jgi:hypothetical protein
MPGTTPARFAWHADKVDTTLASVRYRMLQPLAALQGRGVPIEAYDPARPPESYEAIIFCKSQGERAVEIATAARGAGRAVIYDMCDNLFAAHRIGHASAARIERVGKLLGLATHTTFSTATLAEQIAGEVKFDAPRTVIPDALDVATPADAPAPGLRERWALHRLQRFLARHPDALHCVWFGKSLGRVSGYVHIDEAVAQLLEFSAATGTKVTLTVISNDRLGFWRAAPRWKLPLHYLPWTQATASQAIGAHRVAVIPLERNTYTAGKTMNRPATALLLGLGVVADAIPSYEELRPFLSLDDWQGGLGRYRDWSDEAQAQIEAGRRHLIERYSADAVADRWAEVLAAATA